MKRFLACLVAVLLLASCGSPVESPSNLEASGLWTDYNVHDPGVVLVNGGINNSFSGYRITARILAGMNPCKAKKVDVRLVKQVVGEEIWIVGQRRDRKPPRNNCSDEIAPRYLNAVIQVRAERRNYPTVILKSVERIGNDIDVNELL